MSEPAQPKLLSARPLMMCVVLGAFAVAITWIAKLVNVAIMGSVPWLSFPPPIPFFVPVIMAPIMVKRRWAAMLTAVIAAVIGGGMQLAAGILVELATWLGAKNWRFSAKWAITTGAAFGAVAFGIMFVFPEFRAVAPGLKVAALVIKVVVFGLYGWLALVLVHALERAGIRGMTRE